MQQYPEIEFQWIEPGLSFRVLFLKKNYRQDQESQQESQHELQHELQHGSLYGKVLKLVKERTLSTKELSEALGQKSISWQLKKVLTKLQTDQLVEWTEPEAKSSRQKYRITQKGKVFLKLLDEGKTL